MTVRAVDSRAVARDRTSKADSVPRRPIRSASCIGRKLRPPTLGSQVERQAVLVPAETIGLESARCPVGPASVQTDQPVPASGSGGTGQEGGLGMDTRDPTAVEADRDAADLARFGYKQELRRALGVYSSFAVAFSYISPSTGIFTLYFLGIGLGGPAFIWSWPIVALGQFIIGLNFAEVSSHFPVAGSVYQWTKYLANRHYSWFSGWIYLFAGVLTVTAVDVTVPIVLIPLLNGLPFGWSIPNDLDTQRIIAVIVLISTTALNVFGVRLVAIVNNTGVVFEILGMVVFALILLIFYSQDRK